MKPEPCSALGMLGQGAAFDRLLRRARRLELHHGLLLSGAPGTGKSRAARLFAQALLCESQDERAPCGACATCKKVLTGSHADLRLLTVPDDKQEIPVELCRALRSELALMPVEGRARVVVIDPADGLNEQGQNALLKTLEEPGADTYLLLVTSCPEALLDTVRSRVERLRIRPLGALELRKLLGGSDACAAERDAAPADLDAVVRVARGSLGAARQLLAPEAREIDGIIAGFLCAPALRSRLGQEFLQGVTGRSPSVARARLVLALLRARLREQLQTLLAMDDTGTYLLGRAERWTAALEAAFTAEEDLGLHIGAAQVLDGLFLTLAELLTGRASSA